MSQNVSMSHENWRDLSARMPTMQDFKLGPAPDPVPFDTYTEKWMKLVWMEEYCSMIQFKQDQSALSPAEFEREAFLSITINNYDEKAEAYR
jgi:hypothetical protein